MRLLAALLILTLSAAPSWAARMALVLGNGAYAQEKPLPNAANDARDMAQRLRQIGFTVYEGIDLDRRETLQLVQRFSQALTSQDTALLYYAGHGIQMGRNNYLMPVDAQPGDEDTLTASSIKLQSILSSLENRAKTRIIILDACRNNPFLRAGTNRSAATDRGFMRMDAGVGSFIAFSTEPGNVASDGTGRNSPFTAALLRHIGTPGADIHAVMRKVRAEVKAGSNDRQIPWENSSLIDEVFLAGQPAPALPQSSAALAKPQAAPKPVPQALRKTRPGEVCMARRGSAGGQFCVSSALAAQGNNTYGPQNLFDDRANTAWVEGVRGRGEGEFLTWLFERPVAMDQLHLQNGYTKSKTTYERNGRVRGVRLTGSTGAQIEFTLQDTPAPQSFDITGMAGQIWIQLEILSTYPGTKYQDTALSSLAFE